MRQPLRKAIQWFVAALLGAGFCLVGFRITDAAGGWATLALAALGLPVLVFGLAGTLFGLLAGIGEWRLRRGIGVVARWDVSAADWSAFLAFDAGYAAAQPAIRPEFVPRAPDGRAVRVVFGPRQVMLDDSYHAVSRRAVPALQDVAWLAPEGAPECLAFLLAQPRGRYGGGLVWLGLRVPVPAAAREEGARVYHHFRGAVPAERVPLPLRRPALVAAWGVAILLAGLAIALGGWLLAARHEGVGYALMIGGLAIACAAWLLTLILLGAALLRRRQDDA